MYIYTVQADQEDGTAEVDLPFSQHQAPHSWGFLFVGGWVDLNMVRYISLIIFIVLAWGQDEYPYFSDMQK
jgi:hypothetical protein